MMKPQGPQIEMNPLAPTDEELHKILLAEVQSTAPALVARATGEIAILTDLTRRRFATVRSVMNPVAFLRDRAREVVRAWLVEAVANPHYDEYASLMQQQGQTPVPKDGFNRPSMDGGGQFKGGCGTDHGETPFIRWMELRNKGIGIGDNVQSQYSPGTTATVDGISPQCFLILKFPGRTNRVPEHKIFAVQKVPKADK